VAKTGSIQSGSVVWVLPTDDITGRELTEHPAIVLTPQEEIDAGEDLFVVYCSTTFSYPLPSGWFDVPTHSGGDNPTGLRQACVAKATWRGTVPQNRVIRITGRASTALVRQILQWLRDKKRDADRKKHGRDPYGNQRWKCLTCGKTWVEAQPKPLGRMNVPVEDAKRALHLLVEGSSIRSTCRLTGLHKKTVLKLLVHFGEACRRFLDQQMRGLTLDHLEFDEQWTFVLKKQSRLTLEQRERCHDIGDVYLWTCIDQRTKLMPAFLIGKRNGDNGRSSVVV
jgi:transposase-like protein